MEIFVIKYRSPIEEKKCLESVRKFTNLEKHKLTVFDNEPENINLGVLWNRLIEASDEDDICLLNSDTIVEEGWTRIEELLTERVGAVGPTTNNCGTVQKDHPISNNAETINDLSGFCYCFRKSVWKEVGGFPEDMPFYGQESIFNRKLQDKGYKLACDTRVFVAHEKGASYKKAIERGETTSAEETFGAFHYYNYLDRLRILRSIVPNTFKIIVIGGWRDNPFPLHKGIQQAVDEMFGANGLLLRADHCIKEWVDVFKPNLILNTETKFDENVYEFLRYAKRNGVKTALYFTDLRSPLTDACKASPEMCGDLSPYYDAMFFCSDAHRNVWEASSGIPVYYMPQGSIQHPKPPKGEKHRVLFIGADSPGYYHQNRNSLLADFRRGGVEVTIKNSPVRESRAEIETKSYGDYHTSDYSLAISMNSRKYASIRLYNTICAGACTLAFKAEGLDDIFRNNEHILWFTAAEEAKKIMERTTEEQREEIKLNAFKFGQKHHTLKMRLLNILLNLYTSDKSFKGDLNNLWKIGK
jgi:hypothetical protein